jgi:hypothetical protein
MFAQSIACFKCNCASVLSCIRPPPLIPRGSNTKRRWAPMPSRAGPTKRIDPDRQEPSHPSRAVRGRCIQLAQRDQLRSRRLSCISRAEPTLGEGAGSAPLGLAASAAAGAIARNCRRMCEGGIVGSFPILIISIPLPTRARHDRYSVSPNSRRSHADEHGPHCKQTYGQPGRGDQTGQLGSWCCCNGAGAGLMQMSDCIGHGVQSWRTDAPLMPRTHGAA